MKSLSKSDITNLPTTVLPENGKPDTIVVSKNDLLVHSSLEGLKFGEFEIQGEIGRGAMGRVYKAWQESKQRYVALKTLQPNLEISKPHIHRLKREGLAQEKLDHPNIVAVHEFGEIEGTPYIAFELVGSGETLQKILKKGNGPLHERRAAEIILELAKALEYSHQRSVIHRDIKPANIILDGHVPKLTDFGLAFLEGPEHTRISQSGDLLGTIGYMSPEQIKGTSKKDKSFPQPQWDIYSLGVTFYELLTGKLPFLADSPLAVIKKIMTEDPSSLATHNMQLSKNIEAICIKCLEKSPQKRYQTASELIDDLTRFLNVKTVKAAPIHWPLRRLRRAIASHKSLILIVATLISLSIFAIRLVSTFHYSKKLDLLQQTMGNIPPDGKDFEFSFLTKAAKERNIEVRMAVTKSLLRFNSQKAYEALSNLSKDPDANVRFHVASILLEIPHPKARDLCQVLIYDNNELVVSAALRLAGLLKDESLLSRVQELAFSKNKIVRGNALSTCLELLGDKNHEFVKDYLLRAQIEGRHELLNRLKRGQTSQPVEALIMALQRMDSIEEKRRISEILTLFTNGDFGLDAAEWTNWWNQNKNRWHSRRCLAITWASLSSKLQFQDIVWAVDGNEIFKDLHWHRSDKKEILVLRNGRQLTFNEALSEFRSQVFFVGTLDGVPVGDNGLIKKMAIAAAK